MIWFAPMKRAAILTMLFFLTTALLAADVTGTWNAKVDLGG
jgi:hypothetical protein